MRSETFFNEYSDNFNYGLSIISIINLLQSSDFKSEDLKTFNNSIETLIQNHKKARENWILEAKRGTNPSTVFVKLLDSLPGIEVKFRKYKESGEIAWEIVKSLKAIKNHLKNINDLTNTEEKTLNKIKAYIILLPLKHCPDKIQNIIRKNPNKFLDFITKDVEEAFVKLNKNINQPTKTSLESLLRYSGQQLVDNDQNDISNDGTQQILLNKYRDLISFAENLQRQPLIDRARLVVANGIIQRLQERGQEAQIPMVVNRMLENGHQSQQQNDTEEEVVVGRKRDRRVIEDSDSESRSSSHVEMIQARSEANKRQRQL